MDLFFLEPDGELADLESTVRGWQCCTSYQERWLQRPGISRCQVSLRVGTGRDYLENAAPGRGARLRPPRRAAVCLVEKLLVMAFTSLTGQRSPPASDSWTWQPNA